LYFSNRRPFPCVTLGIVLTTLLLLRRSFQVSFRLVLGRQEHVLRAFEANVPLTAPTIFVPIAGLFTMDAGPVP
jgi:hypothetical protein